MPSSTEEFSMSVTPQLDSDTEMEHRSSMDSIDSQSLDKPTVPQPKVTLRKSCDPCAAAKVRCDRRESGCERCYRRCLTCTTSISQRRGRGKRKVRIEDLDILDMDLFAGTQSMPSSPGASPPSLSAMPQVHRLSSSVSDPATHGTRPIHQSTTSMTPEPLTRDDRELWNLWTTTPPYMENDTFTKPHTKHNSTSGTMVSESDNAISTTTLPLFTNEYDGMLGIAQAPVAPLVATKTFSSTTLPVHGDVATHDAFLNMMPTSNMDNDGIGDMLSNLTDAVDRLRETMEVFTSQTHTPSSTPPYDSITESINRFKRGSTSNSHARFGLSNDYRRAKRRSIGGGW